MLSVMANAATALRNFWLWRGLFKSSAAQLNQEHHLISLVSRFDYILNELIHETSVHNEYQLLSSFQVQQLASHVQHGIIPSLQELADAFPQGIESPEAKHLLIRYIYFLNRAGEMGKLRSEQLNLTLQLRSRGSLLAHLKSVYAKYQPESSEAREFRNCVLYLQNAIHEMEQALFPLLEQDPSQGDIIYLRANRYQIWGYKAWQWLNRRLGIQPAFS